MLDIDPNKRMLIAMILLWLCMAIAMFNAFSLKILLDEEYKVYYYSEINTQSNQSDIFSLDVVAYEALKYDREPMPTIILLQNIVNKILNIMFALFVGGLIYGRLDKLSKETRNT